MSYTSQEEWRRAFLGLKEAHNGWVDWLRTLRDRHDRERTPLHDDALWLLCHHAQAEGWPAISPDANVQASYAAQRLDGAGHNFAEMVCLSAPPMSNTDREFLEGRGGCYDQFEGLPFVGQHYKRLADEAGVSTTGQVYLNGLARFPGDPEAWVSGRGDVKRRIEERGWSCQGSVNVAARSPDAAPAPDVAVADDILDDAVCARLENDPDLARLDQGELRHETEQMIKPHWA